MKIQQCFSQLSVSCPQVICHPGVIFNLLSLFLLMYWHRYFTMTFCMISYILLSTCQKWRNKDVQSVTGVEDYLNSELPKSPHTSPSRASYGASLWDICTKMTAIHRGSTIYRCLQVPGWNNLIKEYDIYIYILIGVVAKYCSCVINATYMCFIAPAHFDVKYVNIRNCHLNDICSRLDIEGPIS